jgi:hypothetical protein
LEKISYFFKAGSERRTIHFFVLNQGMEQPEGAAHSTSRGRSHGNQNGTGFREKQGAGNSIEVHVPGRQTEAFPKVTHGKILNSVLIIVGHMGISNGMGIGPTLSGGIGRSGRHTRGAHSAERQYIGVARIAGARKRIIRIL